MDKKSNFRYFETEFISYYAPELSEIEILKANEYDQQLITAFKFIVLPLSVIILSNVLTVEAAEQIVNNTSSKRTWSQFAKDWTGVSVLLKKDVSKTAKALQATRTVTEQLQLFVYLYLPL
jgi:RNA polymerase subunit RPABC4/transcription elongation factor Spt4